MNDTRTDTVKAISRVAFTGNIISHNWYKTITLPGGKPDWVAIVILGDVVYWYKETIVRDEDTNEIIERKNKFASDKLQKTYLSYAEYFGLSKRQVKEAIDRLVELGILVREFRTLTTKSGMTLSNVMYLEPVPQSLLEIEAGTFTSHPHTQEDTPSCEIEYPLLQNNVPPITPDEGTCTYITTETTTEKNSPQAARPSKTVSSCDGSPVEIGTPSSSSKKNKDNRAELKEGRIGCPQCGELFTLEDMGDGCNCPNCQIGLIVFEVDRYGREKTIRKPSTDRQPRAEFKTAPVDAFCKLVKTTCSGERQRAQWGYQLQKVAEPRGATPEQVVQAINMIPDSEYAWQTFSNPYQHTFQAVLDMMLARVIGRIEVESKKQTTSADPWGGRWGFDE